MKKFAGMLSLLTAAVMLLGIAAMPAAAESGSCGENLIWSFENGVLTVSGEGGMTDYYSTSPGNMPPWIELPVTSIIVEEGVTSLGVNAFAYFKEGDSVVSISLPASLTEIGRGALGGRLGVISVDEGNEVFKIVGDCLIKNGSQIVLGCDTSVIPTDGSILSIGYDAFSNCGGLTEIVLPDGIVTIADRAFADCKNLVSVTLPEGLKCIGQEAFAGCYNLNSINLPDGLETIMYYAFSGCDSLESVTVPASVKADSAYPFGYSARTTLKVYAFSFAHRSAEYFNYSFEIIGTIGDFDDDGEITVSDALTALRIAAKLVEPDEDALVTGDLDFDGRITVDDALTLLRIAVGLVR
ncbi:MAG: leucine-rich repeat protein [Clostridia bacterium]|nr:leucine-rich repeat protein [Clostridia bacterium]